MTVGGPGQGNACTFPFTVGGQTFTRCTKGRVEAGCVTATYFNLLTITTCKVSRTAE